MRKRRRLITQRFIFYRMTFMSLSKKFINAIQSQLGWRRRL